MKKCKKLLIAAFAALALTLICPSVLPNAGVTKVEAAVKISKKKLVLMKGQTKKLKITGTSKKVTWKSSKKAVATVNKNGKVTAKKKGTAKITATVGKKKYKCTVTVQNPSLNKKTAAIKVGKTITLKMKGTNQKVTWKSSNTSVATVSGGKVTGMKAGTAKITAMVLKKKYTCTVTVKSVNADTVTWSSHQLDDGILTIVKNNYAYNVDLTMTTVYYSSNGSMLGANKDSNYCLEPGNECVMFTYAPFDSNYDYVSYASYKTNFSIKAALSSFKSNVSGLTWTANKGVNCVMVKVTNKSNPNAEYTSLTVVFYKNGKVIGYDTRYPEVSTVGSSDYLPFEYPWDSNYDYITPDSYKVFVDYSFK